MSDPVILDTHTLIWLMFGEPDLGPAARQAANAAGVEQQVLVSAITFWEVAMLAAHGRLMLREAPSAWCLGVIRRGIEEVSVSGEIGIMAAELKEYHRDPADRIIAATAISRGATLITSDHQILAWSGGLARQDARA